ncbi:MAG: PD40 domain-containing protein [Bacteroidales bacterium]|nr:PD40 domain-containing protein [Bacteroidales bacterium]
MIRISIFAIFLSAITGCEKPATDLYSDKESLSGNYMNEPVPGLVPQRFCPSFFSFEHHTPPIFSPDGTEVYWKLMDTQYPMILGMVLKNGKWSKPFDASFNLKGNNDAPYFSPDGLKLFFVSSNGTSGDNYDENIFSVDKDGAGWSRATRLPDIINNHPLHWEVTVTSGLDIVFQNSADHDIWYSECNEGNYQVPVKLPPSVNGVTTMEGSPYISPDGSYLLFDRRTGSGDSDLFMSVLDQDGNWGEALNLGSQVNSTGHEFYPYVTYDGKYLFFLRMTGSGCYPYWVDASVVTEFLPGRNSLRMAFGDF